MTKQPVEGVKTKLEEETEVHQPEELVENVPMNNGEREVAKVVYDHEEDIEEVGPQDVLGPAMADDVVPTLTKIV